jgi:hypothetical protein
MEKDYFLPINNKEISMKLFKITFAAIALCWTMASQAACPGTCANVGDNPAFDQTCSIAGIHGKAYCESLSALGCAYFPGQSTPGRCVHETNDAIYAQVCEGAALHGKSQCEAYAGLGCVWAESTCQ